MKNEVLRVDEKLARKNWPLLTPFKKLHLGKNDALVVCAGFEDRAAYFIREAINTRKGDFKIIAIKYKPAYGENKLDEICNAAEQASLPIEIIEYDRHDPSCIGSMIIKASNDKDNIYIDISSMSRLLIVQTLVTLKNRPAGFEKSYVLYAEAETYSPSREKVEADMAKDNNEPWPQNYISSGVFEVAATPELSSIAMLGEEIRLIAFPSFSPDQLFGLTHEIQPTYLNIISGKPPYQENEWRENAIKKCNEATVRANTNVIWHQCSTLDYRETLHVLLEIYNERQLYDRLLLAPTGSKMQSVATGLLRAYLDDIQVVYPTPAHFQDPSDYSIGVGKTYMLDLSRFQ